MGLRVNGIGLMDFVPIAIDVLTPVSRPLEFSCPKVSSCLSCSSLLKGASHVV